MSANDKKTNNKNRVSVITFILFLALIVSSLSLVVIIARNNLTIDNIIGYYVDVADVKTINFKDTNLYNGVKENLLAQGIEYTEDGNILSIQIAEEDISKVTSLNLASMNIFNISGIDNFTNLTDLNLEGNKITDISPLNNLNIVTLNLKNNKLTNTITNTITNTNTLPLIFKQSQDPNSSIYTPNKLVLSNCTVSQDNSLVTVNDNINSNDNITVTIKGGTADGTTLILTHIPDTLSKETSVIPKTNTTEETNKKEETNKTIKFEDENMYNSVKENLITQGIEYKEDITNKTLTIKDDNIAKVTTLNLANKNISNISGIENFTSLINLDLSGNKISDTSLLNNLKIVNLNLKNNSITDTISLGNTSYYLPLIFTESKNTNSNLYTANELDVYNCTISEDKKSIILNEGLTSKDTIIVILDGGIADGTTLTITIKDTNTKISNDTDENTNIANTLNESSILPISTADAITSEDDSSTLVTIEFKDKNMYDAVKSNIGNSKISSSDDNNLTIVMTKENIGKVTNLSLSSKNISDISGIDKFTSLTRLYLYSNKIVNIEALKSCTKLTELRLNNNQIEDISALKNCTKLTYLSLYSNQISDISALESCTELTTLYLNSNKIVNIEALKSCTALNELNLGSNQIADISALVNCTVLTKLELYSNKIVDIRVLEKLINLTYLNIGSNQIADISALKSCTALTKLELYGNKITDIGALKNCTELKEIRLQGNQIVDTNALGSCTKLTTLQLNNNKIVDVSALGSCTALTYLYLNNNQIVDVSTLGSCTALKTLHLYSNQIEDISALGSCTALTSLSLYSNQIEDISVLKSCTELTSLQLDNNKIIHISVLGNCTKLTNLSLSRNKIVDISALEKCTKLTYLSLYSNQISDINALKNCTALKTLYLENNQIEDISALRNCTALKELKLTSNQIEDISALGSCTELTTLYLYKNKIEDISELKNCTKLTSLYLESNQIEDISALGSCTSLKYLRLEENQIADISALESCTALTSLNLSKNQITDTITSKTYQLPTIFTESLNPDSEIFKLYNEKNKLVTKNCTLSNDNKSIIINDKLKIGDSVTVSLSGSGCAHSTKLTLNLTEEYLKETTPTITYNNTNWTNQDVTATISFDKENISVKDANGDYNKNIENYTHLFKSNGSYTFEYKDEANEITGSATASVKNIDKVNPTANITNSNITTRSFDLNIQALDNESGVKKIDIYVDNTLEGTVSYNNDDTNNKELTHKIDDLLPNTIHTVYIEVEDKAGNKISTKNNAISVTTESLPNIEECIDINYTPNTWTNDNVKVTISQKDIIPEYLSIEYIVEGDNTSSESYKLYDSIFTVDKNCKIKARLTDGANTSDEKSIEITNIDKIKPNISVTNSNITTKSFDLNIQALDNESGIASIKVYVNGDEVKSYDYTEDKEVKDKNLTYTVDNLEQSKVYSYYIEVEDKVGNVTKGNEEEITTNTIPSGEDSLNVIYTPTDWTNNTVEISIEKIANIQSDFTIEYLVEKEDKVEDIYTPYTDKFTVDENCKIKTRLTDGKNIGIEKVVDITNIDKTLPKVAITNLSEIKQNSFSLNLIGQDEESGIKEIRVFVNGKKEKVYTYDKQSENLTEEKHQEFKLENLTQNTNYTYYIEVEDQAGNITSTEALGENVTTNSIQSLDAEITYEPQNWTNKNVEVAITPKMDINEDLSLQYKVETQDGKKIVEYTTYENSFEVNTNCVVKAKLTDGINSSNEVTKIITNIDKEIPSMSNVDVTDITTKSFKLNIHAKDEESGIAKIYVYLDDKIIYTYDYTSEETLKEKDIVYNVDNLNDNTNYRYYIVIEDKAGNTRTSKDTYINNEKVIEEVAPQVRTNAIPDIYENVDINISPNSWTNENVLVTINTINELAEGVTLQYKVEAQDGKEIIGYTTYENSFEVNTNCVVKAKLTDGVNESSEIEYNITNIDKTNPETLETVISSITQNKFSIDIKGKDEESGIKEIRVYVNDKLEETYSYEKNEDINLTEDIQETFTMSDLIQDTNYKYYVEVEDQAGNITSTQELNDSVTTSIIQQLDVEVLHTPENWTNKNVLVTILPSIKLNEGIYLEYEVLTKDSKVVSKYKKYEEPFEVEDNYIIKTRLTDGINTSNEKLDIVENIDKVIPNVVNAQVLDITENSFKLHIMAQDENSGVSKIRVYLNDKVVKVYEYTENLTKEKQEQLVIDSLEENTTYSYYIEVEDSAGNIKNSKSIYNIETGDIQEVEAPTITTKEKEIKNVNTSDSIYFIIPVLIISLLISIYINLLLNKKDKTNN